MKTFTSIMKYLAAGSLTICLMLALYGSYALQMYDINYIIDGVNVLRLYLISGTIFLLSLTAYLLTETYDE